MLKKAQAFTLFIILIAGNSLFAHMEARLAGEMTWEWESGKSRLKDIEEDDLSLGGIQFELLGHKLGYGLDALIDFREDSQGQVHFDWQGQLFLRYHLFGNDGFLDPFIEAGYGNAGSVLLEDGEDNNLQLSLFPSFSAGINLVFEEGLIVGGRLSYRPSNVAIPAADIEKVPLGQYQSSFMVGLALGRNRHRKNHHGTNNYYDDYFEDY